jgi:hypothetical protein
MFRLESEEITTFSLQGPVTRMNVPGVTAGSAELILGRAPGVAPVQSTVRYVCARRIPGDAQKNSKVPMIPKRPLDQSLDFALMDESFLDL